ncbi:hypothetical protein EXIGLDRAFT_80133 [Exidia glandulosa HHB12029]|uniref:F-box domain-containing protein n=1 Tax=Exidia glandulosa HHB12029 TaxID=1314781 RepID=A0A165HNI6_EXIGL|nr:hypothetical protein EXIGLDRAFT_80133 [Exidia glandulosa HHB12029]
MPLSFSDLDLDVLSCICSELYKAGENIRGIYLLKPFSMTCRQVRTAAEPILFRSVVVELKLMRDCARSMRQLRQLPTLLRFVREFSLYPQTLKSLTYTHSPEDHDAQALLVDSPDDLPTCAFEFIDLLRSFNNLEKLTFKPCRELREAVNLNFPFAFAGSGLRLESVKFLATESSHTFLCAHFPSITQLALAIGELKEYDAAVWVRTGGRVKSLCLFHATRWDTPGIQTLVAHLPSVTELTMQGRTRLRKDLVHLRGLTRLTTLSLPRLSDLDLDYDPPWCGTSFFVDIGSPDLDAEIERARLRDEQMERELAAAKREAKRLALSVFPHLRTLRFEGTVFNLPRSSINDIEAVDQLEAEYDPLYKYPEYYSRH